MKRLALFLLAMTLAAPASADYVVKDGNGNLQTIKAFNCTGSICPQMTPTDQFGAAFGTSGNPFFVNFPSTITINQGTAGASPWLVTWAGNLGVTCSNCSSSGVSVPFAGAIGANGTPGGFKDASSNFQPFLGDVTNGQWVSVKASVLPTGAATSALQTTGNTALGTINTTLGSPFQAGGALAANQSVNLTQIAGAAPSLTNPLWVFPATGATFPVSGTFYQATQPVSNAGTFAVQAAQATAANLNATVVGTGTFSVQLTGATNNINNIAGTISLPTGAATSALQTTGNTALGTINTTLGTPMQSTGGSVTANAGTNLNTSLLALEAGGNLASLVTQIGAVTASPTQYTIGDRLKTINTTIGTPMQASGGSVTANAGTNLNTSLLGTAANQSTAITALGTINTTLGTPFQAGGNIGNTSFASTVADGANVTQGAKADAKSTATDTTPITLMQVMKEISAMEQTPASRAVYGPTAVGSATANPPVPVGGSADGTATGNVNIWKVGTGGIGFITGNLTQGGSALSATNGLYTNLLQGNAVLSATNPVYTDIGTGGNEYAALTSATPALNATAYNTNTYSNAGTNPINADLNGNLYIHGIGSNGYPAGAVPITASATGTTGATTATLTNVSGHTTYICGYSIRANATAVTTVTDTITGVITATMSSILWVGPAASGIGTDENVFSPCIPASGVSTSIAVVSGAPGTGGNVSVRAWGYSL